MKFERFNAFGVIGFGAAAPPWQFVLLQDAAGWTTSYRLIAPTKTVSASSTIIGPFETFEEAKLAAENKLSELRRLS